MTVLKFRDLHILQSYVGVDISELAVSAEGNRFVRDVKGSFERDPPVTPERRHQLSDHDTFGHRA